MKKFLQIALYAVCIGVFLGGQAAAIITKDDQACARAGGLDGTCFYEDCSVGSSDSADSEPDTAHAISGDAQSLAQQIMSNGNIGFDGGPQGGTGTQFQRIADGKKATVDTGREVDVEPIILVTILHLAQGHKVNVSQLTNGDKHTAATNPHGSGKAADINIFDGQHTIGTDSVADSITSVAAEVLPDGARFGLGDNGGQANGTKQIGGKTFATFKDDPSHVHIDVLGVAQADDDAAVNAAGAGSAGSDDPAGLEYKGAAKEVGASVYGGGVRGGKFAADGTSSHGAGGDLKDTVSFAELSNDPRAKDFSALGNLPEGAKVAVSYKGRTVIAEKRDVGAGGNDVQGKPRAVDLWWQTAKLLNFRSRCGRGDSPAGCRQHSHNEG